MPFINFTAGIPHLRYPSVRDPTVPGRADGRHRTAEFSQPSVKRPDGLPGVGPKSNPDSATKIVIAEIISANPRNYRLNVQHVIQQVKPVKDGES